MRLRDKMAISRGFDHGNFVNAYETTDYSRACEKIGKRSNNFLIGFTAGFFASYETHEIDECERENVEACRAFMREHTPWIAVD
ncbi:MAG: hypothetical protein WC683_19665 [bacterium]